MSVAGQRGPSDCVSGGDDPRPALLEELNRRRSAVGAAPLRFAGPLCAIAGRHAAELARRGDLMPELRDLDRLERETVAAGARADRLFAATVQLRGDAAATWEALATEHPSIGREAVSGDLLQFGAGVARFDGASIVTVLFSLPRSETMARRLAAFADLEGMRRALLEATNRARLSARLSPLERDPVLDEAAQAFAERMLRERFYDHVGPDGVKLRQRLANAGYRAPTLGENLARGLFSPEEVVERWLSSSGHRRNLVSPRYHAIGLGVSYDPAGGEQSVHWVQIFSSLAAKKQG